MEKNTHIPQIDQSKKIKISSYIILILVILFFFFFFSKFQNWLGIMDFSRFIGKFGTIGDSTPTTFVGLGGSGACQGFLFSLSLIPGIMLALGIVELAEHLGALYAAQHLLTPLMKPLFGLPGISGLALISSLHSSDSASVMTRELYDKGFISNNERTIFGAFQFSAGAAVTNYLTTGLALFPFLSVKIIIPLCVILFYKVVGMNVIRLYLILVTQKNVTIEQTHG